MMDNYECIIDERGTLTIAREKKDGIHLSDNPFADKEAPQLAPGKYMIWIYFTGSKSPEQKKFEEESYYRRLAKLPAGCIFYRSTQSEHSAIAIPEIDSQVSAKCQVIKKKRDNSRPQAASPSSFAQGSESPDSKTHPDLADRPSDDAEEATDSHLYSHV